MCSVGFEGWCVYSYRTCLRAIKGGGVYMRVSFVYCAMGGGDVSWCLCVTSGDTCICEDDNCLHIGIHVTVPNVSHLESNFDIRKLFIGLLLQYRNIAYAHVNNDNMII